MNKAQKWIIGVIATVFTTWTMLVLTPAVAHATPAQDALYLQMLSENDFSYGSASMAIAQAQAMCYDMDESGYSAGQIVFRAMRYYGLDYDHSVAMTAIAITVYCPWDAPTTKA